MRYHFIQEHNGQFQNSVMFRVLDVRASAFYKWKTRPVSQRQQQKETLVAHINELFHDSDRRYSSSVPLEPQPAYPSRFKGSGRQVQPQAGRANHEGTASRGASASQVRGHYGF